MDETIVELAIISDTRTPEMVTEVLGIPCDKGWHTGDTRKHTIIVEKNNGWVVHSGLPRDASLEAHIEALRRILEPAQEGIRRLSSMDSVGLSIVIYSSSAPALYFSPSTVCWAAALGAYLDIDLYII